ncbi:hypothetical protein ACEQ8H_001938 [Pleosporales sp. CAS-2024a]
MHLVQRMRPAPQRQDHGVRQLNPPAAGDALAKHKRVGLDPVFVAQREAPWPQPVGGHDDFRKVQLDRERGVGEDAGGGGQGG